MAKRRSKKRTHREMTDEERSSIPRSLVIKMGDNKRTVSNTLSHLVQDFRQIMEPYTAAKLRERKNNKLKDFVVMAGPLGVSHMFIFSISENNNTGLRVARTPRGPTLSFHVKNYSLCKDISASLKSPKSVTPELLQNPPLLVMNGFSNKKESDKEALLTTMFQNMFPALNVATTKLSGIRRVLILNKDAETGDIELRHYSIEARDVDVSKPLKKLSSVKKHLNKGMPSLAKKSDVADFLLDDYNGFTSESEVEDDAMVHVAERKQQQLKSKGSESAEEIPSGAASKKAIKLIEIGPRLQLELRKIEDGICTGKTLYHSYIHKTEKEQKKLDKAYEEKERLRNQRRKAQEENVRKKKEAEATKVSRTKRGILKQKEKEAAENSEEASDVEDLDGGVSDAEVNEDTELFDSAEDALSDLEKDSPSDIEE